MAQFLPLILLAGVMYVALILPQQRRTKEHRSLLSTLTDGDEVVTSPFSFVASANVIAYERATPVFADIDPVTLNLDPAAAAAAVTPRTKVLLPTHYNAPLDPAAIAAFRQIAREFPITVEAAWARDQVKQLAGTDVPQPELLDRAKPIAASTAAP